MGPLLALFVSLCQLNVCVKGSDTDLQAPNISRFKARFRKFVSTLSFFSETVKGPLQFVEGG